MRKLFAALALIATGCTFGPTDTDPNVLAARQIHSDFIKSAQGFGVDPARAIFHDSFESSALAQWIIPAANSSGDLWKASQTRAHFGMMSLTYGGQGVITKAVDLNQVSLATKDSISLSGTQNPVLVLFACFDRQGPIGDETAFQVSISSDLGFTWTAIAPKDIPPLIEAGAEPKLEWKRYRYDLSAYKDQVIRLKLDLKSSISNRKLLYIDDVLVAEDR